MARLRYPQSEYEKRSLAARRGRATRERREALYATHPKAVVDAGWTLMKNRSPQKREVWFNMLEAQTAAEARRYQEEIFSDKNYEAWMNAVYWGREESKEDATDWPMWSWY